MTKKLLKIGTRLIGDNQPTYIVAEAGLNHQGDLQLAKKLVDAAKKIGVDAVKFQKRDIHTLYKADVLRDAAKEEHGSFYLFDHILKSELSEADMEELCKYVRSVGLEFLCTPWDMKSLEFLSKLELPAYKVASPDMFNLKLISAIAKKNKPMIISTGMSFVSEIEELVTHLKKIQAEFVLLHTNSTYPAPNHDLNLKFLSRMKKDFDCLIGYSGHELHGVAAIGAVALGACLVEKHLTLDRGLPGPDHRASLLPDEFAKVVQDIHIMDQALGEAVRFPSRGEYLNRESLSKSLVAAKDLKKGEVLKFEDIDVKSPGKGTSPLKLGAFVGKKLIARDIEKDDYLLESDFGLLDSPDFAAPKLNHKWGIVARMSDIDGLLKNIHPDFVEIHLTDTDIEKNSTTGKKYELELAVHGTEYFGELLLDLSSLDKTYRQKSIDGFNRALEHARFLKQFFANPEKKSRFVVHPGGMNMKRALMDEKEQLYENLYDSLQKLNPDGFELLVENMPGCPWYFGGQWFHASFMDAQEIVDFSKKTGYGITFDISHAALFCNLYRINLTEFAKIILPVTKYLHISDGARFNGEGLQIGDGTVNFKELLELFVKTDLPILPEIWQGHKFGGFGFVKAINELKKINPAL